MALEFGFYINHQPVLEFRNHDRFLDLFTKQTVLQDCDTDDDFYVDMRVLNGVAADLRRDIQERGFEEKDVPAKVPRGFWRLDGRNTPWEILLPVYPLFVWTLRRTVYQHGTLICGWSA